MDARFASFRALAVKLEGLPERSLVWFAQCVQRIAKDRLPVRRRVGGKGKETLNDNLEGRKTTGQMGEGFRGFDPVCGGIPSHGLRVAGGRRIKCRADKFVSLD